MLCSQPRCFLPTHVQPYSIQLSALCAVRLPTQSYISRFRTYKQRCRSEAKYFGHAQCSRRLQHTACTIPHCGPKTPHRRTDPNAPHSSETHSHSFVHGRMFRSAVVCRHCSQYREHRSILMFPLHFLFGCKHIPSCLLYTSPSPRD